MTSFVYYGIMCAWRILANLLFCMFNIFHWPNTDLFVDEARILLAPSLVTNTMPSLSLSFKLTVGPFKPS